MKPNRPKSAQRVYPLTLTHRSPSLFLVVQEGGSSGEHYPTLYNTERAAQSAAEGHRRASYACTDPIPVSAYSTKQGGLFVAEADLIELVCAIREAEYR